MTTDSVAKTATLVHGWTMEDVDRAAAISANRHWYRSMEWDDKRDLAWHGIVELLYSSLEPPAFGDFIEAGLRAITDDTRATERHHGYDWNTGEQRKSFGVYWSGARGSEHADFAEGLCERLALPTALSVLTPRQYECVVALASFGTLTEASAAMGLTLGGFASTIYAARARVREVWFEHETPVKKPYGSSEVCRNGHARAQHGYTDATTGVTRCRICMRNYSRRSDARERTA